MTRLCYTWKESEKEARIGRKSLGLPYGSEKVLARPIGSLRAETDPHLTYPNLGRYGLMLVPSVGRNSRKVRL